MSALPIWKCEFLADSNVPLDNLTVGAPFQLRCNGDIEVGWTDQPVLVQFPKPEMTYTLTILKTTLLDAKEAVFAVTAYKAGSHQPEYVRIVQGENGFEFTGAKWDVKSVLKQGEQPQPFPPFGPWSLGVPWWVAGVFAALFLALILVAIRGFRRRKQRRAISEQLNQFKTPLTPIHQFYRDSRNLRRKLNAVKSVEELQPIAKSLEREFRLYILRQFQIPALDWSPNEVLRDLKRKDGHLYWKAGAEIRKTLRELGALAGQNNILVQDVEQIHRLSLTVVDKVEALRMRRRA